MFIIIIMALVGIKDEQELYKTYSDIMKTHPDMDKIIENSISSTRETKIEIMGLTLYQMWQYTKKYLKKADTKNVKILFCMIDGASPL